MQLTLSSIVRFGQSSGIVTWIGDFMLTIQTSEGIRHVARAGVEVIG